MNKRLMYLVGVIVLIVILVLLSLIPKKEKENEMVEIKIKDYGTIVVEMDRANAPITVDNFINLVNNKFYDGLVFHRIMSGFMIQGGAPNSNSNLSLVKNIKGEFKKNGVINNISHTRGVISMARANDMNSASTQFFIVHQDSTFLDGNYAGFGYVVSGMDVVDKICDSVIVTDDNGTVKEGMEPIIESIRIIEKSDINETNS